MSFQLTFYHGTSLWCLGRPCCPVASLPLGSFQITWSRTMPYGSRSHSCSPTKKMNWSRSSSFRYLLYTQWAGSSWKKRNDKTASQCIGLKTMTISLDKGWGEKRPGSTHWWEDVVWKLWKSIHQTQKQEDAFFHLWIIHDIEIFGRSN